MTPTLSISWVDGKYTVTSDAVLSSGFKLQSAPAPIGPWTDAALALPYTLAPGEATLYFRAYSP